MELKELYDQIKNPLDDPKVMNKLLDAYSKSYKGIGGFYGQLTETVKKNNHGFYKSDSDQFYSTMFNQWKNSIVSLTKEQFTTLYKKGSFKQDLVKLRNYLKTIPDIQTKEEAESILNGNYNDRELEDAFERYRWDSLGEFSGWVHVSSRYLNAKKEPSPKVEHRLYLNIESIDLYRMANILVKKCNDRHLPFYFKFDPFAGRDDTLVIYSSTEHLTKYIEILQEIKKENEDIVSRTNEPPILTGKIDNWVGYGSEPEKTPDGKKSSFNKIRSESIEPILMNTTIRWILDNKNMIVKYEGKRMTFIDYLTLKATKQLILELQNRLNIRLDSKKMDAQRNGTTYNPNEVFENLGYTSKDIASPTFRVNVYKILKQKMEEYINGIYKGTIDQNASIKIKVRHDKSISYTVYSFKKLFSEVSIDIRKLDTNYINSVKSAIIADAPKYGIFSSKYCFDKNAIEKMVAVYKANKNNTSAQTIKDIEEYKKYLEQYKNQIVNKPDEPNGGTRRIK